MAQITKIKNLARIRKIVAVFARNGFQDLINKIQLGNYVSAKIGAKILNRWVPEELAELSAPVRLRKTFEELGPTFVKLGQLLASRPDLIPQEFCDEFKRLHDQVQPVSFSSIKKVIEDHYKTELVEIFPEFSETPLASASIAQVHTATLLDGTPVVVKVQRPGIQKTINEDLVVLEQLVGLIERYVPESHIYNPRGILKEFGRSLELETNFVIESNNIKRFAQNFADDPFVIIPKVYSEISGQKVLVMEQLMGRPLSQKSAIELEGGDPTEFLKLGVRTYLKMVYTHGFFHGDLHAGNLFVMPNNRIGLIDFGVVGRLTRKTRSAIASMFMALAEEDFERMAYVYVDLAPYNDHVDVDGFAQDLAYILGPYIGMTMKQVNIGRLLMQSSSVAAKHGIVLPSELVIFFKSIVAIEGVGRSVSDDFDFMGESLSYSKHLIQSGIDPKRLGNDLTLFAKDINQFLYSFPRQLRQTVRRINHPNFTIKTEEVNLLLIQDSIDRGFRRLFYLILFIATVAAFLIFWFR